MTKTMIEARGTDYVTNWPLTIAKQAGIPEHWVLKAVKEVTGESIEQGSIGVADNAKVLTVVGAMDGPTAKRVIARAVELCTAHRHATRNNCHFCGLPMRNGECQECV